MLFTALSNTANSFPTMNTFTSYNIYFAGLANTATALTDSSVYVMLYSFSVPGIISPGLYKFNFNMADTSFTYTRLGNIQSQVLNGKLHMACNISDLLLDPNFGSWPPQYNSLGYMAGSIRLDIDTATLTPTFTIGDFSAIAQLIFENHHYQVTQNTPPVIQYIYIDGPADAAVLRFSYFDANGDYPLFCQGQYLSEQGYDFIPQSLDFSQPVMMYLSHTYDLTSGVEYHFNVTISDDSINFVTGPFWVANDDETIPAVQSLSVYPHPFNPTLGGLHLAYTGNIKDFTGGSIHNLKGQLIRQLKADILGWDGADDHGKTVTAGIYLLRANYKTGSFTKKVILVR